MKMLTMLKIIGVKGEPKVLIDLPGLLRIGDPISLRFKLSRVTLGRSEILDVNGRFRVDAVGLDASSWPRKQLVSVDPIGSAPSWQAIKKNPPKGRRLPPAKSERTSI
jgi:hypothetical protein